MADKGYIGLANLKDILTNNTLKKVSIIDQPQVRLFLDKITFTNILLVWTGTITMMGIAYFLLSNNISYLYYNSQDRVVDSLLDSIYFSFVTATSTGFGDIIPIGTFKVFAILEVIIGLLLLSFVTFKLVSLKQDLILNDIYEISFHEKLNRIRSSLLLFRQNTSKFISKLEDGSATAR
ncbi:two pore domain potassium channel family protein, partial [Candidatus Woesearchaeota archaeon]|nr:two pore domain potassium channel family protein [Candidatus Woesearchaeota archaeon]